MMFTVIHSIWKKSGVLLSCIFGFSVQFCFYGIPNRHQRDNFTYGLGPLNTLDFVCPAGSLLGGSTAPRVPDPALPMKESAPVHCPLWEPGKPPAEPRVRPQTAQTRRPGDAEPDFFGGDMHCCVFLYV